MWYVSQSLKIIIGNKKNYYVADTVTITYSTCLTTRGFLRYIILYDQGVIYFMHPNSFPSHPIPTLSAIFPLLHLSSQTHPIIIPPTFYLASLPFLSSFHQTTTTTISLLKVQLPPVQQEGRPSGGVGGVPGPGGHLLHHWRRIRRDERASPANHAPDTRYFIYVRFKSI